jgi:hypothetical protein
MQAAQTKSHFERSNCAPLPGSKLTLTAAEKTTKTTTTQAGLKGDDGGRTDGSWIKSGTPHKKTKINLQTNI